jgi:hypothetical protein
MSICGRVEAVMVRRTWMRLERTNWVRRRGKEGLTDPPHQNTTTCSLGEGRFVPRVRGSGLMNGNYLPVS